MPVQNTTICICIHRTETETHNGVYFNNNNRHKGLQQMHLPVVYPALYVSHIYYFYHINTGGADGHKALFSIS